jgi:anti-anti-sigma factor
VATGYRRSARLQTQSARGQRANAVDSPNAREIIDGMNLTTSLTGDTQHFKLTGRLSSEDAPEFERQCLEEIRSETRALILDLTGLEYLSSAGLCTILSAGKSIQARGGKLVLCVQKGLILQIIEASGFHKLFTVVDSVPEAGKHSSGTFRIHMHKEWDVDIMTVFGRVDAERAPELEAAGRKILVTAYQKLVVNMSAVEYLSSAGLCALLNLGKLADSKRGRLFLCSPSASVRQILHMSGFDKIFKIRNTVQDALVE